MEFKVYLLYCCLSICRVYAETNDTIRATDVDRLLTDKLTSYNTDVRPRWNQVNPLSLNVTMHIVSIQGIDEVEESMSIVALMSLIWQDEFMMWNESNYGGVREVLVNQRKVWTPSIMLLNSMREFENILKDWNIVRYNKFGYAFYYLGDLFSVSCRVDATFYPWDRQKCSLTFAIWGYTGDEIKFIPTSDKISLEYFTENGAWDMTSSNIYVRDSVISFDLVLNRKPTYVVVNVMLPVFFMAVLNILVFFIPTESGERMSYSITVLLAIAVFLTIVGDNLPKTSNPMSTLSYLLVSVLAISVLIIFGTVHSLRIYHRDDKQAIGRIWRCVVTCLKCACRKRGRQTKDDKYMAKIANTPKNFIQGRRILANNLENSVHSVISLQNSTLQLDPNIRQQSVIGVNNDAAKSSLGSGDLAEDDNKAKCLTWRDVSECYDKLAIVLFSLSLVTSISVFLAYIFINKDSQ